MNFECKTIPILHPILNSQGIAEPLCNTCTQLDCSNPIRKKTISILGKTEQWHIYIIGNQAYQVVQCVGYMKD